jgi:4'-phosphopantetheinyl transferase
VIDWLTCLADDYPELGAERPPGLSALEREALAVLLFPKRRREWLLGRWTAKRLLQRCQPAYRSLPLQAITVGNDADGAPYLSVEEEGRLAMSLSISHRDDRAFCALSPTLPPSIGADIERIEPRDPAFVHDFFTTDEDARVWTCPPSRRDTLITVVWSAKESVLKALRHGLRVDTRRVEIVHVAGIEGNETIAGFPSGGCPSVWPPPDETWHEIQIKCAPGLWPGGPEPSADSPPPDTVPISAWWRPWEDYVLTIATSG